MIKLEGINPVFEALKAGSLVSLVIGEKWVQNNRVNDVMIEATSKGIHFEVVTAEKLDQIAATKHHQGVIGYVRPPQNWSLKQILEETEKDLCVLLLDRIQDPHNLGAILRTCEATMVDAVVIPKKGSVSVTPAVHRVSMGGSLFVPVFQRSLHTTVKLLKNEGVEIIGLDQNGEDPYYNADLSGAVAIVAGGENKSVSPVLLGKCDRIVRIPMHGKLESLNVSVATSIVLYERVRQISTT
jgi:23S rRNA (guanosine2251-2'-O)-methyltransferase